MTVDPAAIAARLRARRAPFERVFRLSAPGAFIGIPLCMVLAAVKAPELLQTVVGVPVILAFAAAWVSGVALWILGIRDMRNMFRPGSARAYDSRGEGPPPPTSSPQ